MRRLCSYCFFSHSKLQKINLKGQEKLEKELDIVRIVTELRKLSIVFNSQMVNDDHVFAIENSSRSIILLDTSDDS